MNGWEGICQHCTNRLAGDPRPLCAPCESVAIAEDAETAWRNEERRYPTPGSWEAAE